MSSRSGSYMEKDRAAQINGGDPAIVVNGPFHQSDIDRMQRKLGRGHIQMSIAGTIGTGLFLGLGEILAATGPLGMILIYILVSSVVYATLASLAEMTAFAPISGTFPHYAARWVHPALGFANAAITVPAEITACAVLIGFWDSNLNHTAIYIAVICILLFAINLFGVRVFGHSEVFFATLKLMLLVGLIIGGIVVTSGGGPDHQRHGFQYWRNPGPMVSYLDAGNRGRFVGLLVAVVPAAFSMGGVELIAISAAETRNPRRNIIMAMRTILFRIIFFYILLVFILGLLVPSNDPAQCSRKASTTGQSPFVLAFNRAGIQTLPSVINAVVLSSAFSSGNSLLYAASRILYGLAVRRQAPRIFAKCTASGTPWVAILAAGAFALLSFLNVQSAAGEVFNWFVNLSTVGGLLGWGTMNLTYLRYYHGLRVQGINPEGIYRSPLQPFAAMWGLFWVVFFILISGISVFWSFNASDFVAAYINLPIFAGLFLGFKIFKKTKMSCSYPNMGIPTLEETEKDGALVKDISIAGKIKELI
ncbi:general amino acid permease variant 2 [Serpula lacrymans var. lacrymans S7.9]|uniref:General amino acid permease variant 2 n=1 Tax=Serpula lacrymans var. lacrymans (strain S7.9) TaxID=578457 RepID=F8PC08_SERL9|nr:general amino acid permease variant 2 [Serpula lacrymans var. lacrymans S7.9]EGO19396.1 general amino acid permease variant 2 [Serpula lacrymans var. lacrymans S7.9]